MDSVFLSNIQFFGSVPGLDLIDIIIGLGIFAVLLVIFAESGLLIGFFLPGDSLLFTVGVLYHAGILPGNMPVPFLLFLVLLSLAAILGDTAGYWFGRKAGPHIFNRPNARLFKQNHIQKAQEFYEHHGGKTIVIARFVPIVRTFAPIVAGAAKMNYKHFLAFNIIGGLAWTFSITSLGYFAGAAFETSGMDIDHAILPIIALIIFISVLPPAVHILKDKRQREALWGGTVRQLRMLFYGE